MLRRSQRTRSQVCRALCGRVKRADASTESMPGMPPLACRMRLSRHLVQGLCRLHGLCGCEGEGLLGYLACGVRLLGAPGSEQQRCACWWALPACAVLLLCLLMQPTSKRTAAALGRVLPGAVAMGAISHHAFDSVPQGGKTIVRPAALPSLC